MAMSGDYAGLDYFVADFGWIPLWQIVAIWATAVLLYVVVAVFGWPPIQGGTADKVAQTERRFIMTPVGVLIPDDSRNTDSLLRGHQPRKLGGTNSWAGNYAVEIYFAGRLWRSNLGGILPIATNKRPPIDTYVGFIFNTNCWRFSVIGGLPVPYYLAAWRDMWRVGVISEPDNGPLVGFENFSSKFKGLTRIQSGTNSGYRNAQGESRIKENALRGTFGPQQYLAVVLEAMLLGGFILGFQGIDGGSDLKLFGGWLLAAAAVAIGTIWIIVGHFPFFPESVSTGAGIDASATCYSRAENIRVLPIVVTKFKLGNVERHVFSTHLWNAPNGPTTRRSTPSIDQTEPTASPPGLTRWSVVTSSGRGGTERLSEQVLCRNCRIKSGNDD
jgi:hypothetical protein